MLTPQQVQDQKFVKAVFGGYDMTTVDEFLGRLSADYATLYKENAVLKSKLKVLVESIEEYRSVDESMRKALVSAQKMANSLIVDAQKQAEQILNNAHADAEQQIGRLSGDIKQEEERLNHAKKETAGFICTMKDIIRQELIILDSVPELKFEGATKDLQEEENQTAQEIGDSVDAAIAMEFPEQKEIQPEQPEKAENSENGEQSPVMQDESAGNKNEAADELGVVEFDITVFDEIAGTSVSQDTDPKPKFNFDNLQFGKNFSLGKKEKK